MFRPSPTWISIPDHEVYRVLQATLRRFATNVVNVDDTTKPEDEYYCEPLMSPTRSSSPEYETLRRSASLCPNYLAATDSFVGTTPTAFPNPNLPTLTLAPENSKPTVGLCAQLNPERDVQAEQGGNDPDGN